MVDLKQWDDASKKLSETDHEEYLKLRAEIEIGNETQSEADEIMRGFFNTLYLSDPDWQKEFGGR